MFYNSIVFHVTPFLLFIFFILPTRSGMRRCTQKSGTWIIFLLVDIILQHCSLVMLMKMTKMSLTPHGGVYWDLIKKNV